MKLLICVQAVDQDDHLMGFFHRWLEVAALRVEHITVLALRVGRHDLPTNVKVISLDPQRLKRKVSIIARVLSLSWQYRASYDAVFVRGDAIYLVLAGWLWRILGKRIAFWYAHYGVFSPFFWIGSIWAQAVLTSVPEANPLRRAWAIGQHTDTTLFTVPPQGVRFQHPLRVLHIGRISPVKRVPWIIEAISPFLHQGMLQVRLVGKPIDVNEEVKVLHAMEGLPGITWEKAGVTFEGTRAYYQSSDIFLGASPGSLDKTILEAAACGCIVLTTTPGMRHGLPPELQWLYVQTSEELQSALERILQLSTEERGAIGLALRVWVEKHHSMITNITRTIHLLEGKTISL